MDAEEHRAWIDSNGKRSCVTAKRHLIWSTCRFQANPRTPAMNGAGLRITHVTAQSPRPVSRESSLASSEMASLEGLSNDFSGKCS